MHTSKPSDGEDQCVEVSTAMLSETLVGTACLEGLLLSWASRLGWEEVTQSNTELRIRRQGSAQATSL